MMKGRDFTAGGRSGSVNTGPDKPTNTHFMDTFKCDAFYRIFHRHLESNPCLSGRKSDGWKHDRNPVSGSGEIVWK